MSLPESCGNAIRLFLSPPAGARHWRILRMPRHIRNDYQHAAQVYQGTDTVVVDTLALENEVKVFYVAEYHMDNGQTHYSNESSATPASTYEDFTTDVVSLMRARLEAGLMEEVKRGTLFNEMGYIQVLTAPPSLQNNLAFPLVTLILENESPAERSVGEQIDDEYFDEDTQEYVEQVGWLADVNVSICGWSLNPDERIELRKAIRRILIANFNVFAVNGILLPSFTLSDVDAVSGEFDAPMYLVNGDFSCQAPVRIGLKASGTIVDTNAEVTN